MWRGLQEISLAASTAARELQLGLGRLPTAQLVFHFYAAFAP